ncbi:uncharacterized protein BDZ99DRAFT_569737 [Mytilinidion resinicola]|uniref:Uncharacterized protein n=1 Tax=Mytilinidion resinicola TaxID=574789 RepID=A0A6A6YSJ5_9PEZI|nr:uncharacterized protein BDZ99DRAFT_569737 [Mytilinidion resinicola]KAF2811770.1 hypothetical protein BDZ99DRAFT_569737 [Mytilinidion resinicola]
MSSVGRSATREQRTEAGIRVIMVRKEKVGSTTPEGSPPSNRLEYSKDGPTSVPAKQPSEVSPDRGPLGPFPKDIHPPKQPPLPQITRGSPRPLPKNNHHPKLPPLPPKHRHDQVFLGTESGRIFKPFPDEKFKMNGKLVITKEKKRLVTQDTLTPLKERYKGNFWDLTADEKEVLRRKPLHPNPNGFTNSFIAATFAAPGPSKEEERLTNGANDMKRGHTRPNTHRVWPSPRPASKERSIPEDKKRKRVHTSSSDSEDADAEMNPSPLKKPRIHTNMASRPIRPPQSRNTVTSSKMAKPVTKTTTELTQPEPSQKAPLRHVASAALASGSANAVNTDDSVDRQNSDIAEVENTHEPTESTEAPKAKIQKKFIFSSFAGVASTVFTFCTTFVPSTHFPFVQTRTTRATRAHHLAAEAAKSRKAKKITRNLSALAALAEEANARAEEKKQLQVLDAALDSVLQQARLYGVSDGEVIDRLQKRSVVLRKRELGVLGTTRNWVGKQMLKKADQLDRQRDKLLYG